LVFEGQFWLFSFGDGVKIYEFFGGLSKFAQKKTELSLFFFHEKNRFEIWFLFLTLYIYIYIYLFCLTTIVAMHEKASVVCLRKVLHFWVIRFSSVFGFNFCFWDRNMERCKSCCTFFIFSFVCSFTFFWTYLFLSSFLYL